MMMMDFGRWRLLGAVIAGILFLHYSSFCSAAQAPIYTFMHQATTAPPKSFYDYIIIGGGTAGCPLGATLSQNSTVLVLERGDSPYGNPNITNLSAFGNSLSDLSPTSPSQRFISEDGVINARGRVLGGGSCLNAGFYSRAATEYVRAAGWDERLVKESYEWVEKVVAYEPPVREWQSAVRDGLVESGVVPYNGFTYDHLYGTKVGGTIFDKEGRRHTSADLLESANPNGLIVLLRATVHKILFRTRDSAHLKSLYSYPNLDTLRAALQYPERSWAKLLNFEPTYRYSGPRKARVTDFLLEASPEPDPTLPQINLVRTTAEEEMTKRNRVRALLTETPQAEVPQTGQTSEAVVALPSQQPSSSRASKRARTTATEPRLADEDETVVPQTTQPSPPPERSDRATSSKWVPKTVFQNRAITESDSVVAEKDHLMAFNLAKGICLSADMAHHDHLTELKAIRSATKSMVLAIQKNHIAHQRVLELRKTTREAMAEANAKTAELKTYQQKTAELEAELTCLTGLVTSAEADKQKALTVMKDKYLRELVKLEGKKNAEITELKKKADDANAEGFKEGEAVYIQQCEAAKDLFFKCGWRAAVMQLGHQPKTEVYNPPPYFIPGSMAEYTATV